MWYSWTWTYLYFISKYLYTSGQMVVPVLAIKLLFAATSQTFSSSQRPLIRSLIVVSCSWHTAFEGMLGCTQIDGSLRPYIVPTISIWSKMLWHDTKAFCPSHTIVFSWEHWKIEVRKSERCPLIWVRKMAQSVKDCLHTTWFQKHPIQFQTAVIYFGAIHLVNVS